MPVMTRMRDNMSTVLIILVVAFIITIVFEWGMDYAGLSSQKFDYVGKINDRKINYQEFVELVKERAEQQKTQTGQEPDENQLNQIRDEVWNSLVNQTLIDEEIQRLGIRVPDQEIIDWVRGENPPEFLTRQFIDSLGQFNRAAYESAIDDPRNKDIWIQIESGLRKQRMQEKLQSVLLAGVRVPESEILQRYSDQSIKFDIDYVLADPDKLITDEAVEVTDSDIEKFYNKNSTEFKVEATRKIKYVKFTETASSSDTQSVINELNEILRRVKLGEDFRVMVDTYSEVPFSDAFFKHGELSPEKENKIFSSPVGSIVGPFEDTDGYHLIKILEEKTGTDEYIKASHILVSIQGDDSAAARSEAAGIIAKIKQGEDFAELAKKHSQDPGSGQKGGDLGWFGKGRMVKPFEDACYKAPINQIVGPVKTQFGYHIIKVTGKSKKEMKVADLVISVKPSSQTRSEIHQRASDFQYLANESEFEKEAGISNYQVIETQPFTAQGFIPGIGLNRQINRWAFESKVGSISEVFGVTDGWGVFYVSEIKKEGIRPLEEVKEGIKPRVLREKKLQLLKSKVEELRKQIPDGGELSALTQINPVYSTNNSGQFTVNAGIPGIGRDLALLGAVQTLEVGKISKPIEGNRGYYIVKLLSKSDFDTLGYTAQKSILENQILQTKKNQFISDWLEDLKKKAEIEDNRDLFFR